MLEESPQVALEGRRMLTNLTRHSWHLKYHHHPVEYFGVQEVSHQVRSSRQDPHLLEDCASRLQADRPRHGQCILLE